MRARMCARAYVEQVVNKDVLKLIAMGSEGELARVGHTNEALVSRAVLVGGAVHPPERVGSVQMTKPQVRRTGRRGQAGPISMPSEDEAGERRHPGRL